MGSKRVGWIDPNVDRTNQQLQPDRTRVTPLQPEVEGGDIRVNPRESALLEESSAGYSATTT